MKRLALIITFVLLLPMVGWATDYYCDSRATSPGSITSGTFTIGEVVIQSVSSAKAKLISVEAAGPMVMTRIVGVPGSTSGRTWTGMSSGAVFTQTNYSTNGSNSYDGTAPTYESGSVGPKGAASHVNSTDLPDVESGDTIRFAKDGIYGSGGSDYLTVPTTWSGVKFDSYGSGTAKPLFHNGAVVSWMDGTNWSDNGGGVYYYSPGAFSVCNWVLENENIIDKASDYNCSDGHWFFDVAGAGGKGANTLFYKPSSGTPANHNIYRIANPTTVAFGAATYSGLSFSNLAFRGTGFYTSGSSIISGITISNCDFDNCNNAVYFNASTNNYSNIKISGCTFNYYGNLWLESSNTVNTHTGNTIENCVITNPHICPNGEKLSANADYDIIGLQNPVNMTISGNDLTGSIYSWGAIDHWRANGVNSTGNVIKNNFIRNVTKSGIGWGSYQATGYSTATIYNNIIANFGTAGGGPWGGFRLAGSATGSSYVYNNTIYNGDIGIYLYSQHDYWIIKNNIVSDMSRSLAETYDAGGSNNVIDFNDYYAGGGVDTFGLQDVTGKTWNEWKAVWTEANSITSDPQFVNAGGSFALDTDFIIPNTSPCYNAGVQVKNRRFDYGDNLIRGKPDIGAWEYPGGRKGSAGGVTRPGKVGGVSR